MANQDKSRITVLFKRAVAEIADGLIQLKEIARKPGIRTKVAVQSMDDDLDAIGVCVGTRGDRIKKVVNALNAGVNRRGADPMGFERVDIFEWSDDLGVLIRRALQPYRIHQITMNADRTEVTVTIVEESLNESAGRLVDHVELASEICHCVITVA